MEYKKYYEFIVNYLFYNNNLNKDNSVELEAKIKNNIYLIDLIEERNTLTLEQKNEVLILDTFYKNNKINIDELIDFTKLYNNTNEYYLIGNLDKINIKLCKNCYIIKELSTNYEYNNLLNNCNLVSIKNIPLNIYNTGILIRDAFSDSIPECIYNNLINEHIFQSLTESNKSTRANRKGLYITNVYKDNNEINYKLLRCSTNLDGPTDNFRNTSKKIVELVNNISNKYFKNNYKELNHVLAQIYYNNINEETGKSYKSKIKTHSDKTKDMPKNALMAFCSFYDNYENNNFIGDKFKKFKKSLNDNFDYVNKGNVSMLTKLRFRLKSCVNNDNNSYKDKFDIILYPNSLFIITLEINRLYTHEIIPPSLNSNDIPTTRMGYVIRSSITDAKYNLDNDNVNILMNNNEYKQLRVANEEDNKVIKEMYLKENTTDEIVYYNNIDFTLNNGDLVKPFI